MRSNMNAYFTVDVGRVSFHLFSDVGFCSSTLAGVKISFRCKAHLQTKVK